MFEEITEHDETSPLTPMTIDERLVADYHGTGLTIGPHPIAYRREELRRMGIVSAGELKKLPHNKPVIAAGAVITRQRPGTAKGLITEDYLDQITRVQLEAEIPPYAQHDDLPVEMSSFKEIVACIGALILAIIAVGRMQSAFAPEPLFV
jgi:hypothetical protein